MTNHMSEADGSATVGRDPQLHAELAALRRRIDDLEADLLSRSNVTNDDVATDDADDDRLAPRVNATSIARCGSRRGRCCGG